MGGFEAGVEVDRPLAGDVVGNFDFAHLTMFEICSDNIIGVDTTKIRLVSSGVQWEGSIPFSALQVTDSIWKDKAVACADRLNNAACDVVLTSTRVRLVDRVKLATTTCDLDRHQNRPPFFLENDAPPLHVHFFQYGGCKPSFLRSKTTQSQALGHLFGDS